MGLDSSKTWTCTALTDIWTGDAHGQSNRLITTGVLGSIRWWFEVLTRGFGGSVCDPTQDGNRCPDMRRRAIEPGHHCLACEIFGCTGWARKFRFDVLDADGEIRTTQIKKEDSFRLRLTPLRPIDANEWALLDLTIRLVADYGAIAGKTVFKPSDEAARRNMPHHKDYGLVRVQLWPQLDAVSPQVVESHAQAAQWRRVGSGASDSDWASIKNLWFIDRRYLARQGMNGSTFNQVLGRKEPKGEGQSLRNSPTQADRWLAGGRGESKKVFSFRDPPRTFGFVKPGSVTFTDMCSRLKGAWPDLKDEEFIAGHAVRDRLLASITGGAR